MTNIKIYLLITAIFVSISSCKKTDPQIEEDNPNALTVEENSIIENMPTVTGMSLSNIILPNEMTAKDFLLEVDPVFYSQWSLWENTDISNGTTDAYTNLGPQDARNLLVSQLDGVALNLMNRSKHVYAGQNGIAYSYGSKTLDLQKPPAGECQDKEIVGLDCVGFLYQLFTKAGVKNFPGPGIVSNDLRKPATIENAIRTSIPALDKIKVEDLGKLETSKIIAGDIIYWTRKNKAGADVAFHIGIIVNYSGRLVVAQCNGTDVKDGDCEANLGLKRGARAVELADPYWFKKSQQYGIVRINSDISGKYKFHFACNGNYPDFFTEDLNFPTNTNSAFDIVKPFIDSDGSSNVATFHFSWNHETNVLSCSVIIVDGSLPNFERKDNFAKKLLRDNLGYFPMTNEYIHNGSGCDIKVKLSYMK